MTDDTDGYDARLRDAMDCGYLALAAVGAMSIAILVFVLWTL